MEKNLSEQSRVVWQSNSNHILFFFFFFNSHFCFCFFKGGEGRGVSLEFYFSKIKNFTKRKNYSCKLK